ncbi:hypothetical protein GCM10009120_44280 [Sphingobacterium siyangense subsp. cladoniae]|uniref:hypothetical protein n=1 Tax=Sphingobacterium siyangense TaxID=459529 RepID=UPI0031F99ADE
MRYFTHLSWNTNPKNALQAELWEFMKDASNRVTEDGQYVIEKIKNKLNELNSHNARCKPMAIRMHSSSDGTIIAFIRLEEGDQGPGLNFTFHPIKEDDPVIRKIPYVPPEELTNGSN